MKTTIKYGLLTLLSLGCIFLLSMIYKKVENKKVISEKTKHLSSIAIQSIDGKSFMLGTSNQAIVLLFFNTECEHCQYEATEIKKNYEAFKNVRLVFISIESLDKIKVFAHHYELDNYPNVSFGHLEATEVAKNFDVHGFPNVLIYNAQGELQKHFTGEVKIEAILSPLTPNGGTKRESP